MKRLFAGQIVVLLLVVLAASAPSAAQSKAKSSGNEAIQAALETQEKALWEAWKNKDASVFRNNLADEGVFVGGEGVSDKAAAVKGLTDQPCEVKSYSLENFRLVKLDKNTALLTYMSHQDATCGGQAVPPAVYASSIWVKRGNKWFGLFHQETPATPKSTP